MTYNVWNETEVFVRVFDIDGDDHFTLALGTTESDGQIQLSLSFWNSSGHVSRLAELDLGNDWGEDEEGYVYTRIGLAPMGDDGKVDLAPLHTAAADALAAVGASLPA